ncbi:hypothetical protein D3C74_280150 [compost metagenome]
MRKHGVSAKAQQQHGRRQRQYGRHRAQQRVPQTRTQLRMPQQQRNVQRGSGDVGGDACDSSAGNAKLRHEKHVQCSFDRRSHKQIQRRSSYDAQTLQQSRGHRYERTRRSRPGDPGHRTRSGPILIEHHINRFCEKGKSCRGG